MTHATFAPHAIVAAGESLVRPRKCQSWGRRVHILAGLSMTSSSCSSCGHLHFLASVMACWSGGVRGAGTAGVAKSFDVSTSYSACRIEQALQHNYVSRCEVRGVIRGGAQRRSNARRGRLAWQVSNCGELLGRVWLRSDALR